MISAEIPSCLADAYAYLQDGRAFVICRPVEGGVATLASKVTVREILCNPDTAAFVDRGCAKKDRIGFLLGGLGVLSDELL